MGFCLVNNVAIAAAALAARGEKVVIVDYDAHHGNGTQDCFYRDPRVMYVSLHEYPLYPGTGALSEVGEGEGRGTTINFPFPAGTTGDSYRAAIDDVVRPAIKEFGATWLIVSAGFDAHRRDPLTGLALSSGDYADITAQHRRRRAAGPSPGVPRGGIRPPGPRRLDRRHSRRARGHRAPPRASDERWSGRSGGQRRPAVPGLGRGRRSD